MWLLKFSINFSSVAYRTFSFKYRLCLIQFFKQYLSQNLPIPVVPLFPNKLALVKDYSTFSLSPANLFKPSSNKLKQYPKHWLLKQSLSQNLPMPVVPLFPNELAQVKDYSASSLSPRSLVAENESLNPAPRNPMFLLASFKSKLGSMQHLNLHQIIYVEAAEPGLKRAHTADTT